MENKNDVPEGHDPTAGGAGRPAPSTPDSEIPEFLKGPDPDEPEDSGDARTADIRRPREAAADPAPGQEAVMDRGAWEAEFSSAHGAEPTAVSPEPTSGQHIAADGAGPHDGEAASTSGGSADREHTAESVEAGSGREASAETTSFATTDSDPAHTRALPAGEQENEAVRETHSADTVGDPRPSVDAEPDHEPGGSAGVGASGATAAGAGAGTLAGSTVPTAAADADPADPDAAQRTDAVLAAKRRGGAPRQPGEDSDPDAQRRQNARDAALTAKPRFARFVQTVLAIFFPFLLVIGAIRAVASPWFLWLEYHRPGFPVDAYGFSPAERLTYGNYGVDYINNSAPSAYLGNLVDGKGDPLFLGTEVSHMADVKSVIGITYAAGIIMAILAVIICLYLGRRYAGGIRRAFFAGSVITLVAMIALTILAVLNFETFFTDFHELFFAQGNWTFHANDTLIRLYPTQFWMDSGIVIAGLVLLVSVVFLITNWPTRKRRERSRLRQGNRDLGLD